MDEEVLVDDLAVIHKDKLLNLKKVLPRCLCRLHSALTAVTAALHCKTDVVSSIPD